MDANTKFLTLTSIVILIVVGLLSGGTFLNLYNIQSMGFQLAELGLLSLAMMLAMMSGNSGIDLSVVSIANLSGVSAGLVAAKLTGAEPTLAFTLVFIATSLVVGLLCGVFNGLLIARGGYTPILATLGTQLIFIGFAVALTDGAAILFPYSETFSFVGNDSVFGVPVPLAIFIAAAFIVYVLIELAPFGQRFAMMGTNLTAARYAGLNTKRLVVSTYALCGLLSAFTGIVMASRTASVKWDYGNSYLLIAILTVVMAGVHPAGGVGRVINVVLATVALQLLSSTFSILGMSSFIKDFAWGLLLIVSISVPYLLNKTAALRSVFGTRGRPSQPQQPGGAA